MSILSKSRTILGSIAVSGIIAAAPVAAFAQASNPCSAKGGMASPCAGKKKSNPCAPAGTSNPCAPKK